MIEISRVDDRDCGNCKEEIWKDVVNYEGYYQVSNLGNVRSLPHITINQRKRKGRMRKPYTNWKGYLAVCLCKDGKCKSYQVHRLVAQAFLPNPNNYPMINHKDENKKNNNVSNLEWCDVTYNNNYGNRTKRARSKICKPVVAIRTSDNQQEHYLSLTEVSKTFRIHITTFTRAINNGKEYMGRHWYWDNFEPKEIVNEDTT